MARYLPVTDIINRAVLEAGLLPSSDPVTDTDETFIQMVGLLNGAGQELCELNDWQILHQNIDNTTLDTSPITQLSASGGNIGIGGVYKLPEDFNYMIDQTGWDRTNQVAIGGPLSPQDWTYLAGRDLVSQSIYASFRLTDGELLLYPKPAPSGLRITFEYISRNWLKSVNSTVPDRDTIAEGTDVCMLDPLLTIKFLKMKFLQAKGFDYSAAALEFDTLLGSRIGKSEGAPILSASLGNSAFSYISSYGNTGDTGFGL